MHQVEPIVRVHVASLRHGVNTSTKDEEPVKEDYLGVGGKLKAVKTWCFGIRRIQTQILEESGLER